MDRVRRRSDAWRTYTKKECALGKNETHMRQETYSARDQVASESIDSFLTAGTIKTVTGLPGSA